MVHDQVHGKKKFKLLQHTQMENNTNILLNTDVGKTFNSIFYK